MKIEKEEVQHIAKLSRLAISQAESETYADQLGRILTHFEDLKDLDTTGLPETTHPLPMVSPLRSDEQVRTLDLESAMANAPHREGPFFRVPQIMEG
jgi:aspartyl-tRNA(Asn)/glutamyl-tRNA(Gln) amidotransferase subunit C